MNASLLGLPAFLGAGQLTALRKVLPLPLAICASERLYANACSVGNKLKELENSEQLWGCGLVEVVQRLECCNGWI